MCGSKSVSFPEKTPEEIELERAQKRLMEEELRLRQEMFAEQQRRWALEDLARRRAEEERAAIEPEYLKRLKLKKVEIPLTEEEKRLMAIPRTIKEKRTRQRLEPIPPDALPGGSPTIERGARAVYSSGGPGPWEPYMKTETPAGDARNWRKVEAHEGFDVYEYVGPSITFYTPGPGEEIVYEPDEKGRMVPKRRITEEYEEEVLNPEYPGLENIPYQRYRYEPMTEEEYYALLTPEEQARYDVEREAERRQLAALRGELPVGPEVEEEMEQARQAMNEALFRQLGPGYTVSSPGLARLAQLNTQMGALTSAVRHGELSGAEALAASRGQIRAETERMKTAFAEQPFASAVSKLGLFAGGVGPVTGTSGYEGLLNRLAQERYQQMQADLENTRTRSQITAQNLGAIANIAGTIAGIYSGKLFPQQQKQTHYTVLV